MWSWDCYCQLHWTPWGRQGWMRVTRPSFLSFCKYVKPGPSDFLSQGFREVLDLKMYPFEWMFLWCILEKRKTAQTFHLSPRRANMSENQWSEGTMAWEGGTLIRSVCQFPWCEFSRHSWFQATNVTALNMEWGSSCAHMWMSSSKPLLEPAFVAVCRK